MHAVALAFSFVTFTWATGDVSRTLQAPVDRSLITGTVLSHRHYPRFDFNSSSPGALNLSSYAPVRVECPKSIQQWFRPAFNLSDAEAAWVQGRKLRVISGLQDYMSNLHLDGFDSETYFERLRADLSYVRTIGYALSGGGWASALTGTGPLRAFDARFPPAVEQRTGGLLQSMTYFSGLSGGAWPVMSLATNNFPLIDDMVASWHVDQSPTQSANNTANRADVNKILAELAPKYKAGFNVSWAELLGREASYEFVAGPNGGLSTLVSGITNLSNFQRHEMPLPIWQAAQFTSDDIEQHGIAVPYYNSTLFEWSPFEFGSWDGPKAFFPTAYLGTNMMNGQPVSDCVLGYDRASFMLAAAADAWNFWLLEDLSNGTEGVFSKRKRDVPMEGFPITVFEELEKVWSKLFNGTLDTELYLSMPNPFASTAPATRSNAKTLSLADESEAGQAMPLWSQVQPARNADLVMTWDNDEDAAPYGWNSGKNLYDSYIYATNHSVPFPVVPPVATILNRGYNLRPTFFGCEANLTNTNDTSSPIIMYMANAPYSSYTNFSIVQETFTGEQMSAILTNGFNVVTQGNGTWDSEWPECIACAAIDRSFSRMGMPRTLQCQGCMQRYCWDGVENDTLPGMVDPSLRLGPSLDYMQWNKSASYWPVISGDQTVGCNATLA